MTSLWVVIGLFLLFGLPSLWVFCACVAGTRADRSQEAMVTGGQSDAYYLVLREDPVPNFFQEDLAQ